MIDEVRSSDSYISSSDTRLHFGLGDAAVIDEVTIRWTSGKVERKRQLQINREHVLRET
jgi:enediyne biosynthesis protein E4